jgi:hypothetical protein
LIDPATGEDLGIPLVGIMDLVLGEVAGPLIADFKTEARSSDPPEITHEIQLSSYAYLFRHASPVEEAGLEIPASSRPRRRRSTSTVTRPAAISTSAGCSR